MDQKSGFPPGQPPPNQWQGAPANPGWQQFPPQQQQQQQQWPGGQYNMPSAPPSYEEACKHQAPNFGAVPPNQGYAPYMPQTAGYPAVGPYQQMPPQQHPQQQMYPSAHGQFDAGARFTPYAPPTIPPPPPGCMPTAVQMAAASGQTVTMEKKKEGFFKGSGSGGITFW